MKMSNKEKEINAELLNKYYSLTNNNQKKKIESLKDKNKTKQNKDFQKITGSGSINTSGSTPIVVFKKTSTKKSNIEFNQINSKNTSHKSKNEYICDGGLSQKLQKYNNNINTNNNNININNNNINYNMNNIYFNNYLSGKNQQLPNNKNTKNNFDNTNSNNITKKNKEQQQIFSKKLREFNKRPAIQKTEK